MLTQTAKAVAAATIIAAAFAIAGFTSAQAQTESVTKQCGDKWAAAKAAGTTAGLTWPKFLGQCRAQMAAAPSTAAPTTTAAPAPITAAAPAPRRTTKAVAKPAPMAPTSDAVFPTTVSSKYSTLSAGKARMQTCLDQYNANKAANANGGLKWIQKGGGYYSQCNTHLKT